MINHRACNHRLVEIPLETEKSLSCFSLASRGRQRLGIFWKTCIQYIQALNTFESVPPSDDSSVLKNQKISTWLFIFLLISSVAVLLFYNALVPVQKTFTVQQPTYDKYLTLFSKYPNELQCPCKTVSVIYDRFIQVNYSLHYICSSFLVSEQWIEYLIRLKKTGFVSFDFRVVSHYSFQGLRSFCQLTKETIENSLRSFYSNQYVSAYLTPSDLFRQQNEAHIQQFITSTTKRFLFSLQLILNTTHGNNLLHGTLSNYDLLPSRGPGFVIPYPTSYSGCSCAISALCCRQMVIVPGLWNISTFLVPGLYSGCHILESLFASDFRCFHDEHCFNDLRFYVDSTLKLNATILNASLSTKFTANSTVREMIDKLMVEQWKWNITFAKYFDECEPSQCTYTIGGKKDAQHVVTTMIALIGGLVKALKLVVPRVVSLCMSMLV